MAISSYVEMLSELQKRADLKTATYEEGKAHADTKSEATTGTSNQDKQNVSHMLAEERLRQSYNARH